IPIGDTILNPGTGFNPYTDALSQAVQKLGVTPQIETAMFNVPGFLIAIAVTLLLIRGIKESASFNSVIVMVKVLVVVLFIIAGIGYVNKSNIGLGCTVGAPGCAEFMPFGFSGVVTGAAVIFFAYIGFDAVSTAAQESKNPQRDMPIGIMGSLAICTVLYILMSLVMTGLANYTELDVPHPVFVAIEKAGPALTWLASVINVGAIAGLASVVLVMLMGQPRVFYSMARDGLLPATFGKVHPRFH